MQDIRDKLGLKKANQPLPGETTYEETEIGRAPGQLPSASPFEFSGPGKFRVISYDEANYKVEEFSDLDSVGRFAGRPGMVWVQVLGITDPQVVHIVGTLFEVPVLAQEDILTSTSRPKFEEHGDKILAIARAVRIGVEEDTPRGQQISIIASPNAVVSFHENDERVFEAVEKRIADNKSNFRRWGAGYLLYALLDTLVDGMKQASSEERSSDAGLAAWQFAENLTTLLPAAEGKARRKVLADLGVRVVKIGTVYERMNYDKETIAVQAGKPVLFVLENVDAMPHNFVIARPGSMQAVGELAEKEAQNPAFAKQNFVPKSSDVLVASTLMQPQGTQR